MTSTELQNTVKDALQALYHHPDEGVRTQADRWLQDFQHSLDAWQVSDCLLHDAGSNLETLFFCSQMLRSKVQRDFEELPSEAFRPLRDSLKGLLKQFHKGPPKVRTQISIAVAALAVHVPAVDWGDGGIINWVKEEMNSHPEFVQSFLELLSVLPEEVFNYKLASRPNRRRQFKEELISSMDAALNILTVCLNVKELKEQVLEAFASWLRLKHRIPASVLASHPLVLTALSGLNSEFLSEASVNVISELIHYTAPGNSGDISAQMPLIQSIVPPVMSLMTQLKDPSKDEDDVKAIARLFADMGDSYIKLIALGSEESMPLVHAILEVSSHPDYDIASMSFNFWHNLQVNLIRRDSYILFCDEASIDAERSKRIQIFRPSFESLVSLVCFRVKYPQNYNDLSEEDMRDLKQTRYDVVDVLTDAAIVLGGGPTIKILYSKLVEAASIILHDENLDWRPSEAALFCIRAVSKFVWVEEAEVMPQLMALIPKLPSPPLLLHTVCLTIGSYAKWLDCSSGYTYLPGVIDILMKGMRTSEDNAAAAALAFKLLSADCRKKLCGFLDGLFQIYQMALSVEGGFKVSGEDSLHLVEALSMVISELPLDQAKKAVETLCLPIVTPLQETVSMGVGVSDKKITLILALRIDQLRNIFRYLSHPEAVAETIQKLWPLLKVVFDGCAQDVLTMESLCRACKYAVRSAGRYMGITIGAMMEEIQALYQQHPQPCFLYLSSEVIKIFGAEASCAIYLKALIESLFSRTVFLLRSIQDFTSRPDTADDCFLLASRCVRYCSPIFFPSGAFPALLDCSMVGVTVLHRDASDSILAFLSEVLDITALSKGEQNVSIRDSFVIPRGPTLMRLLIACLTGALPSTRIETVSYTILSLTQAYSTMALDWAKDSVTLLPTTVVTETERARFLQALSEVATGADIDALAVPVEELSDICRRNRTVQEIVQGVLRPLELNLVHAS